MQHPQNYGGSIFIVADFNGVPSSSSLQLFSISTGSCSLTNWNIENLLDKSKGACPAGLSHTVSWGCDELGERADVFQPPPDSWESGLWCCEPQLLLMKPHNWGGGGGRGEFRCDATVSPSEGERQVLTWLMQLSCQENHCGGFTLHWEWLCPLLPFFPHWNSVYMAKNCRSIGIKLKYIDRFMPEIPAFHHHSTFYGNINHFSSGSSSESTPHLQIWKYIWSSWRLLLSLVLETFSFSSILLHFYCLYKVVLLIRATRFISFSIYLYLIYQHYLRS